jgi:hypothetical protein
LPVAAVAALFSAPVFATEHTGWVYNGNTGWGQVDEDQFDDVSFSSSTNLGYRWGIVGVEVGYAWIGEFEDKIDVGNTQIKTELDVSGWTCRHHLQRRPERQVGRAGAHRRVRLGCGRQTGRGQHPGEIQRQPDRLVCRRVDPVQLEQEVQHRHRLHVLRRWAATTSTPTSTCSAWPASTASDGRSAGRERNGGLGRRSAFQGRHSGRGTCAGSAGVWDLRPIGTSADSGNDSSTPSANDQG